MDAKTAIKLIGERMCFGRGKWTKNHMPVIDEYWQAGMMAIEALTLPTPQPKIGKWIDMGDFEQCSVCTGTHLKEFQTYYGKAIWIRTPYCHNCGAKMEIPV